jgi:hypothetical protein
VTGTALFLGVFFTALVIGWAWCRCRAWRAEALRDPGPRHPARRQGVPPDGRPLSEAPGGEAEQLAALEYMYRHVSIPEPETSKKDGSPPGGRGQDQEEKR